ncbi:MAG: SOS response-associated peptidase [Streptomycetaceae bacterium]|nr:SOS response-associated peptidase [Streptomycetaceae bacterium]
MCGRYAASRKPEELVELFQVSKWKPAETLAPDWNVAPTADVYAVLERPDKESGSPEPVRQMRVLRWGLVPSWAKSPDIGVKMINARAESVHEKPSYRRPFATHRCLLPADGYYEWGLPAEGQGGRMSSAEERQLEEQGKKKRPRKQPYFVTPADGSVMAMAGLYEFWRDRTLPDDHPKAWWATCTVITTEAETAPLTGDAAEGAVAGREPRSLFDIHPRMPLVLPPARWDAWLDSSRTDVDELRGLLVPASAGFLRAYPVTTAVSNVRNNGPELVEPLPAPEEETLF